jgi:transposase
MWGIGKQARVYLALGATDMRRGINGLSLLVESLAEEAVFSGDLFAFTNRAQTTIKILYWAENGFCLWQKRLERDKFHWPRDEKEVREIDRDELSWLLEGLDISQAHQRLTYSVLS